MTKIQRNRLKNSRHELKIILILKDNLLQRTVECSKGILYQAYLKFSHLSSSRTESTHIKLHQNFRIQKQILNKCSSNHLKKN